MGHPGGTRSALSCRKQTGGALLPCQNWAELCRTVSGHPPARPPRDFQRRAHVGADAGSHGGPPRPERNTSQMKSCAARNRCEGPGESISRCLSSLQHGTLREARAAAAAQVAAPSSSTPQQRSGRSGPPSLLRRSGRWPCTGPSPLGAPPPGLALHGAREPARGRERLTRALVRALRQVLASLLAFAASPIRALEAVQCPRAQARPAPPLAPRRLIARAC